jgi:hypothetical protein
MQTITYAHDRTHVQTTGRLGLLNEHDKQSKVEIFQYNITIISNIHMYNMHKRVEK